jgi:mannose-6-phosphate isomerase-like protein (cupin superfamily)
LIEAAAQLQQAWTSKVIGAVGTAKIKLIRMDGTAYPEECHDYTEGLLVLDGQMMLNVDGQRIPVGSGEIYLVPAGVPHHVDSGSHGVLLILDH